MFIAVRNIAARSRVPRSLRRRAQMILALGMLPVIMMSCARVFHDRSKAMMDARDLYGTLLSQVCHNELAVDENTADSIAVMFAGSTCEHTTLDVSRAMLGEVWAKKAAHFDFAVVDDHGSILSATWPQYGGEDAIISEFSHIQNIADQTSCIAYADNSISGGPALAMWRPVSVSQPGGNHSQRLSVLMLLYPEWFKDTVDRVGAPSGSVVSLHDSNGQRIMRYPDEEAHLADKCGNPQIHEAVKASKSNRGTTIVTGCNGGLRLVAYHRMDSSSGTLMAYATVSVPLSLILREANFNLVYHALLIALVIVLMLWTIRRIDVFFISPIQSLVSMANRISGGDLGARYDGPEPDLELARLSSALNEMAITIQERESRLVFVSEHDMLTGSKNRFFLESRLPEFESADALPLTLMLVNVNNMKLVNDVAGHEEGDRLLKMVAQSVMGRLNDRACCIRWHGDEFLLVMPNTKTEDAKTIGDMIINDVSQLNFGPLTPRVAVGIATRQLAGQTFKDTYQHAEGRMYRNKLTEPSSARGALIESLRKVLSERTHETEGHSARMAKLARALGARLNMNPSSFDDLELLCRLHDIGKVGIPDDVLLKPGPLDDGEWIIMRMHPEIGARIVDGTPELAHIAESILCHHERWDGKGYPRNLSGSDIPLISRILSVVDAFDAMVSDRPYHKAIKPEQALAEIASNSGTQFDPMVAKEFVGMLIEDPRLM